MIFKNYILFCVFFSSVLCANKIDKAYQALSVFDYFKAKQLFYKSLKSNQVNASFGLATIYYKTDNPFSNIDSAAKYIAISLAKFKDTASFYHFEINKNSIHNLSKRIAIKGYSIYAEAPNIEKINYYLSRYYFAGDSLLQISFNRRDQFKLGNCFALQASQYVKDFMDSYPETSYYEKAQQTFYDFEYLEQINKNDINSYKIFLKKFPKNYNKNRAEENLFELTIKLKNEDSLNTFIKKYSTSLTSENAWKLLYSSNVKVYSKQNLENFLIKYPLYPNRDLIDKEVNLAEQILIPFKNKENKTGYVDTLGNWIIEPLYDDALLFSEGFASVCKDDTCFYIDKEGHKIFKNYFEEAESYQNGIAIVKKENLYYLINRVGQIISKPFQEINSMTSYLFVCRENDKYGAINAEAKTIIPFVYNKLGDFKNGYAYYATSKYGLVSQSNIALNPNWDWISDVDENNIVVISKENKFGLMHTTEEIILPTDFDYIKLCSNGIYLIVKDKLYGFYNALDKCYVTAIDYDYNSSYEPNYYSNGKYFKLIKKDEVALIDANGRYSISFGIFSNLFFAKCDIIRAVKNNKYGYLNRKLKPISAYEFEQATDFENNLAIVKKALFTQLIDDSGKVIYSIKNGDLIKVETTYYKVHTDNELYGLINNKGITLLPNQFQSIELVNSNLFRCQKTDDSSIYLFNSVTRELKRM